MLPDPRRPATEQRPGEHRRQQQAAQAQFHEAAGGQLSEDVGVSPGAHADEQQQEGDAKDDGGVVRGPEGDRSRAVVPVPGQPPQARDQQRDEQGHQRDGNLLQPGRNRQRHGRRHAQPLAGQGEAGEKAWRGRQPGPLSGADPCHHAERAAAIDEGSHAEQRATRRSVPVQRIAHGHLGQAVEGTQQDEATEHPEGGFQQRAKPCPAALLHHFFQRGHQAGAAALDGKAHQQRQDHARQQDHTLPSAIRVIRQA
ncbi:hypothetical protein D3C85_1177860 [compost metagenome]